METTRRVYRDGFDVFFRAYLDANGCTRQPLIVPCGSRNDAYDKFVTSLRQHPDDFAILLVDSEARVDPHKVAAASPHCQRLLGLLLRLCKEAA